LRVGLAIPETLANSASNSFFYKQRMLVILGTITMVYKTIIHITIL
jgi:hypothetical protein